MKKMNSSDAVGQAGQGHQVPLSSPFAQSQLGKRLTQMMDSGSQAQRRLAEFMLRYPLRLAAFGIEDLAEQSGVSAPTISRTARELGFPGFSIMRGHIATALQSQMEPVSKLRSRLYDGRSDSGDAFAAICSQMQLVDPVQLQVQLLAIVARLRAARSIYVMGFGLSAHVAGILSLGLQPYCQQVVNIVEFGGTEVAAGRLAAISGQDVLIAITFPRYASDVVRLARWARDHGAPIVALTDSAASPLASLADELLLAPSAHPVLTSTMTTAVALAEALVAALMLSDRENLEKAARLTDAISSFLVDNGG